VADLCRPGLQFAGYFDVFANERPQVIGKTEMAYLESLEENVRSARLQRYFSYPIPCIVIARGMECPEALLDQAKKHDVPVFSTEDETSVFTGKAIAYLDEALAPRVTKHGVLVDVFGVGVLITGESGVGKSECALELIKRGHLLVADDVVDIARVGHKLRGESPEIVRDFMELRGIGIVDIKLIFGIGAVMRKKTVDMVIHLEYWTPGKDYDRLGTKDQTMDILGINVPLINVPVRSGRNLAMIVEIAARNWRLKNEGYSAVTELDRRLEQMYGVKKASEE
jgi:HPr kinase/phosphorylase